MAWRALNARSGAQKIRSVTHPEPIADLHRTAFQRVGRGDAAGAQVVDNARQQGHAVIDGHRDHIVVDVGAPTEFVENPLPDLPVFPPVW